MWFVLLGVALLVAKVTDLNPVAQWAWWVVLLPFGLAVVWWQVTDSLGFNQRRAMRRMEEKRVERRRKALRDLGLDPTRQARDSRVRSADLSGPDTVPSELPEGARAQGREGAPRA